MLHDIMFKVIMLNVIMLGVNVAMLCFIMCKVSLLNVNMLLSVNMYCAIILTVGYAVCHYVQSHSAECHYSRWWVVRC